MMNEIDDDELAFVQLLARQDEPAPIATPQRLIQQVRAQLPDEPPALVARREWQALALRRGAMALVLGATVALLLLGSWSVLVDSTLPARLLAGSGLDRVLLMLALLAKPLLGALIAQGPLLAFGGALFLGAASLWWRTLQRALSYEPARVRR